MWIEINKFRHQNASKKFNQINNFTKLRKEKKRKKNKKRVPRSDVGFGREDGKSTVLVLVSDLVFSELLNEFRPSYHLSPDRRSGLFRPPNTKFGGRIADGEERFLEIEILLIKKKKKKKNFFFQYSLLFSYCLFIYFICFYLFGRKSDAGIQKTSSTPFLDMDVNGDG